MLPPAINVISCLGIRLRVASLNHRIHHTIHYKGASNPICKIVEYFKNTLAQAELTVYGISNDAPRVLSCIIQESIYDFHDQSQSLEILQGQEGTYIILISPFFRDSERAFFQKLLASEQRMELTNQLRICLLATSALRATKTLM